MGTQLASGYPRLFVPTTSNYVDAIFTYLCFSTSLRASSLITLEYREELERIAVLESLPGIKVTICVDGEPLKEYENNEHESMLVEQKHSMRSLKSPNINVL
ncbi:hypothetical protein sscle_05g046570 [Sclerotinia sclerotiorum 1980 UF-70]|uniref:Uncharacterized protein n=1 Tax=Sclerotinia sclerotiorum (strain ATCC 18683 / 1980 / Ss-1) TaxID=665079 RepID=A0A1D9Q4M7_SCLS1|nr:hypothetical protein sscle_05g046570 [Sclerotinia sclerotiorum 1980 UF-70]